MSTGFVADGEWRLRRSPEWQARLRALRESIQARYAAEWTCAGFWGRLILRWRIAVEFRRERRKLIPSVSALYLSRWEAETVPVCPDRLIKERTSSD